MSGLRPILIAPGLSNSGEAHWQTWLERLSPRACRVQQWDWTQPDLSSWAGRIEAAVNACAAPPIIIAHSFGVLAAVQATRLGRQRIGAALLVAPAEPKKFGYEHALPRLSLPFPTILAASRNDPWMRYETAAVWANRWGARLIDLGEAGHVNVDSGYGPWPLALDLVDALEASLNRVRVHTAA